MNINLSSRGTLRTVTALAVVTLLAACATAYQPRGLSGGFTETQLDHNVFRVSFGGNGYTNPDNVEEMALLRSAELTLQKGFTHFAIIDERSRTDQSAFTTPTQATTTGNVSRYGNTSNFNATTTYTGGQTFIVRRPSTTNTIICFKGKPDVSALVYDAQFLFKSLGPKYIPAAAAK